MKKSNKFDPFLLVNTKSNLNSYISTQKIRNNNRNFTLSPNISEINYQNIIPKRDQLSICASDYSHLLSEQQLFNLNNVRSKEEAHRLKMMQPQIKIDENQSGVEKYVNDKIEVLNNNRSTPNYNVTNSNRDSQIDLFNQALQCGTHNKPILGEDPSSNPVQNFSKNNCESNQSLPNKQNFHYRNYLSVRKIQRKSQTTNPNTEPNEFGANASQRSIKVQTKCKKTTEKSQSQIFLNKNEIQHYSQSQDKHKKAPSENLHYLEPFTSRKNSNLGHMASGINQNSPFQKKFESSENFVSNSTREDQQNKQNVYKVNRNSFSMVRKGYSMPTVNSYSNPNMLKKSENKMKPDNEDLVQLCSYGLGITPKICNVDSSNQALVNKSMEDCDDNTGGMYGVRGANSRLPNRRKSRSQIKEDLKNLGGNGMNHASSVVEINNELRLQTNDSGIIFTPQSDRIIEKYSTKNDIFASSVIRLTATPSAIITNCLTPKSSLINAKKYKSTRKNSGFFNQVPVSIFHNIEKNVCKSQEQIILTKNKGDVVIMPKFQNKYEAFGKVNDTSAPINFNQENSKKESNMGSDTQKLRILKALCSQQLCKKGNFSSKNK